MDQYTLKEITTWKQILVKNDIEFIGTECINGDLKFNKENYSII